MEKAIIEQSTGCCENPSLFLANTGEWVCRNCGTCKEREIITNTAERRAYSEEDRRNRYHAAPLSDNMDLQAFYHWNCSEDITKYRRMAHLQAQTMPYRYRSRIFKDIQARCTRYGLSRSILMLAFTIANKTHEMKFMRGASTEALIRCSVYFAARIHGRATTMRDFEIHGGERNRNSMFSKIRFIVLPALNLKVPPVQFKALLFARVIAAELPVKIGIAALDYWNIIKTTEPGFGSGKMPDGIIAALLYHVLGKEGMIGRTQYGDWTQETVSDICHVTEVTLRTKLREIKNILTRSYHDSHETPIQ
jgi:transcription initiation factor TFIIIB Brf1 subunit/transcription initiation factor TFIIB